MTKEPILASRSYRERVPMVIKVVGGLHHLRGNAAPYFALTYEAHRKGFPNQCWSGGAGHDTIREHFGKRFDDLARLHLCDIDGAPMHAVANGRYFLAGALIHIGDRYTYATSKANFPKPPSAIDMTRPWDTTDYREPTPTECLDAFARHMRISSDKADDVRRDVQLLIDNARAGIKCQSVGEYLAAFVDAQRGRWAAEAQDCIDHHKLIVFGDPWPAQAAA